MRSTKASAAVERLNKRSGDVYSMSFRSDGLFDLLLMSANGHSESVGTPLPMIEFVKFVDGIKPLAPKRISKLDVVFRERLNKK